MFQKSRCPWHLCHSHACSNPLALLPPSPLTAPVGPAVLLLHDAMFAKCCFTQMLLLGRVVCTIVSSGARSTGFYLTHSI